MKISASTKIADIIKANKASIDAIASVAKPLERLKNPILRKVMASRVTLAEASKMSGASMQNIADALAPLGFIFEDKDTDASAPTAQKRPIWLDNANSNETIFFDVRPVIENGADPLKEILHRFKEVEAGKIFCIINSFVPTPLIHLLKQEKAEDSFVEMVAGNVFHTYFLKKKKANSAVAQAAHHEKVIMDDEAGFQAACNKYTESKRKEIDVRHLEMPGPMHAILNELENLPEDAALFVHHKRVPVYLLEELADKNFETHIYNIGEGNVKMLLYKTKN
ncbi:MAG: DUF2249 domain-containing protein [Bacteroidetes bacterium]|nr:DUF2249 domain-containing protein [Bacteroidota bacterium]MBS1975104.1 DUF2249 domain-containing protein [Bacteroidota bacterium]